MRLGAINHIETDPWQTGRRYIWSRMSVMTHLFILASYAVVSAAAGLVLSQSQSQFAPITCYLFSGAGFLAVAMLHEIISRHMAQRDTSRQLNIVFDEIDDMRDANLDLMENLARARDEMAVLCDAVETAAEGTNEALVREMKVLQTQLGLMQKVRRPKVGRSGRDKAGQGPVAADPRLTEVEVEAPRYLQADAEIDRQEILGHIREALESNRVDLYVQPIVSLPQRRTRHYEAFSRIGPTMAVL